MAKNITEAKRTKQTVAVIGLGYVGLPLAVRAVERGYEVVGIARNKEKIDMINKGKGSMPAFADVLTGEEKTDLLAYLKTI